MTRLTTRFCGRASPSLVRNGRFLAAGVLALSFGAFAQGETLYVDDDAPPGGKGTSWVSAFQHLSDALAVTSNCPVPVEVRVAQGEAETALAILTGLALENPEHEETLAAVAEARSALGLTEVAP